MSFAVSFNLPPEVKVLPPFLEEIARTGNLSVRLASHDFKVIFDHGLCLAWTTLKDEAKQKGSIVNQLMSRIDLNQKPTKENSLRFFHRLKHKIARHWNRHFVVIDPSVDLPTKFSSIGLLGLKYDKTNIPKNVWQRAIEIQHLKSQYKKLWDGCPIPSNYLDPKTKDIMTLPIFDASHPGFISELSKRNGDFGLETISIDIHQLCHTQEPDSLRVIWGIFKRTLECSVCQHSIQDEDLVIALILQEEILNFMKKKIRTLSDKGSLSTDFREKAHFLDFFKLFIR